MRSVFILMLLAAGALYSVAQEAIPQDLVISLDRSGCFGHCPVYSLTIKSSGSFEIIPKNRPYSDKDPVEPIKGSITRQKVQELLTEFRRIRFYSLRGRYGSIEKDTRGPNCPVYWTDHPTAEITISESGKNKTVSHYLGCKGAQILDELVSLEEKIDDAVGMKQWESQLRSGGADVIDLKLQINPIKPSTPAKPTTPTKPR